MTNPEEEEEVGTPIEDIETEPTVNPLDRLGISPEELSAVMDDIRAEAEAKRDSRICTCGHPIRNHKEGNRGISCISGKLLCPCIKKTPIITVPDIRFFMRKSLGNGPLHALSMGIHAAIAANPESGSKMEWVDGLACAKCGKTEVSVKPTFVTQRGVIMDVPSELTALLCDHCRF